MRKIKYLSEKQKVEEAFKAGSSEKVAEKMYAILSRKVGKSFIFSNYPTEYSNKEGKFLGYYATLGTTLVRINFLLLKSDNVHSVDVFSKNTRKPDTTLHLMGSNIVQVIGQIADYFTGDYFRYDESTLEGRQALREALKHSELLEMYIEENPNLLSEVDRGRVSIEAEYQKFFQYCEDKGRKGPKAESAFLYLMKKYVKDNGLNFNIPSIEVLSGQHEDPINTDSEAAGAFEELIENEHLLKFRTLEYYMNEMAAGNPNFSGVYVYGDGGVGKSYLAKKYLEPLPQTFYMTGKVKGYLGFAKLLFNHRENEIIVMDDSVTKEDMNNSAIENILKAALDPESPRNIKIQTAQESSVTNTRDGLIISLTESEMNEYTKQALSENTEVVDFTSPEGMDSPTDFIFDSKMVFLTNYPKIPQALQDRCWALQMIFTNEQIMDIIEVNIAKIAPDKVPEARELYLMTQFNSTTGEYEEFADIEGNELDTKAVVEFMRTQSMSGLVKRKYSVRIFKRLLALYLATKHTPMWKPLLKMELKA